jgi:hypothetical protein
MQELNAIADRMGELHPETNAGWGVTLRYAADGIRDEMRPVAALLFGAA